MLRSTFNHSHILNSNKGISRINKVLFNFQRVNKSEGIADGGLQTLFYKQEFYFGINTGGYINLIKP